MPTAAARRSRSKAAATRVPRRSSYRAFTTERARLPAPRRRLLPRPRRGPPPGPTPRGQERGRPPAERSLTVREALLHHLREGPHTTRELSGLIGIPEKQVADHLVHVARSLRPTLERLRVEPARCLTCGFVFRKRDRLARPSACPVCRGQHLKPPRFAVGPT